MDILPRLIRTLAAVAAGALLCSAAAAANTASQAEARARYKQDMADCKEGKSHQDLALCRREARNALTEALRGGLKDDPSQYELNAMQRCNEHKGEDRTACEARMRGGRVEGSVEGGGVLREIETEVPAK